MTNRESMIDALKRKGGALTIDELVAETHIPISKLRQILTPYSKDVVRVGHKLFDLAYRVYPGKTFRYSPTQAEIEKGAISVHDDLLLFLIACFHYQAQVTLIDQDNHTYVLKRSRASKAAFSGFKRWYRTTEFKKGDDILFTCVDLKNYTYTIKHQKKQDRDEFAIAVKNRHLADTVFDILNHSVSKYESDLFLVRKYLFIYPFEKDPPPDQLVNALKADKRFLISRFNKILSPSGHLIDDWLTIGLRKYYFQNEKYEWVPVSIISDEFGRYGFCNLCGERMRWTKDRGWKHLKDISEYSYIYLNKVFFREGLHGYN